VAHTDWWLLPSETGTDLSRILTSDVNTPVTIMIKLTAAQNTENDWYIYLTNYIYCT